MKIQNGRFSASITKTAVIRTASAGCKGKQPLKRADRIPLRGGRTGTSSFQVKVHAEKNAKVQLQEVQLLGAGYTCLSDIGASCGENATFELLKLELGAGKVYAGCLTELEGKKSAFDAKIGYYTSVNQKLDMNYTVRHRGKKTESMMEVSGVLQDGSSKLFRGTIDFVPGCAGAKGTERDDVLLLGDDIVNQTIPLILCAEEDVEGNHGASMGDLTMQRCLSVAPVDCRERS